MKSSAWVATTAARLAVVALLVALPTTAAAFRSPSAGPLAAVVSERALRHGDRGPAVAQLQDLLRQSGFDPGPVDGIFGPLTEAAVIAAQRHFGLEVDGLAGRMTVGALEGARSQAPSPAAAVQREAPGAVRREWPQPSETGLRIYDAVVAAADRQEAPAGGAAAALTFHHLPAPEALSALLQHLAAHDARATFFVTGTEAELRAADLQRIQAAGHDVGSLGYREVDLRNLPHWAVRAELRKAREAVAKATGAPPELFRPPLGRFDRQLVRLAEEEGMRMVLWSNAVAPAGVNGSPDRLAAHVLRALHPGAVLMIPLDVPGGVEAAHRVLQGMTEAGYRTQPPLSGHYDTK